MIVDVDEFVGVKSFRAKGKRLTTWQLDKITELEPIFTDEPDEIEEVAETERSDSETAESDSQSQSVIEFDDNASD